MSNDRFLKLKERSTNMHEFRIAAASVSDVVNNIINAGLGLCGYSTTSYPREVICSPLVQTMDLDFLLSNPHFGSLCWADVGNGSPFLEG